MGTRSLTRVNTADGRQLLNLYRQFDGYPTGHGRELHDFLQGFVIVNGYNGSEGRKAANGAGCLAAQLVAHFKRRENELPAMREALLLASKAEDEQTLREAVRRVLSWHLKTEPIGGFYLQPVDSTDHGQDYDYVITVNEDCGESAAEAVLTIEVTGYSGVEFSGSLSAFNDYINTPPPDEED